MAAEWGERLRSRARELGMSDSEVARRLGLTQRRYSSYVNQTREPSFADLLRICEALSTTPDVILGVTPPDPAEDTARRALAALLAMPEERRLLATLVLETIASAASPMPDLGLRRRD